MPEDSALITREHFTDLFLNDTPLLDVRAPVEFAKGAFPASHNVPLLDDEQRHVIGLRYKQQGQDAAIALGESLATPDIRQQRLRAWKDFFDRHPGAVLYCFRGGLRSRLSCSWLAGAGVTVPLVEGGYKALRQFLLQQLDRDLHVQPLTLLSGRTGAGKTEFLRSLPGHIDLEGLAGHRGSSFGAGIEEQPPQIGFENALTIALMKHRQAYPDRPVLLEDEGRMIGRINLPLNLRAAMDRAPLWVLEAPLEQRVEQILSDYVVGQHTALLQAETDVQKAQNRFEHFVLGNLNRIRKRLGGKAHAQVRAQWQEALRQLFNSGEAGAFRPGIRQLLTDYYDPMYDYQLSRRDGPILGRGLAQELRERLTTAG